MHETRLIMGMPIEVQVVNGPPDAHEAVFAHLTRVDERFSTYKDDSEISALNRADITHDGTSDEMKEIFEIGAQTKRETDGYFDMRRHDGLIDPSGVVKGWAIHNAAALLA